MCGRLLSLWFFVFLDMRRANYSSRLEVLVYFDSDDLWHINLTRRVYVIGRLEGLLWNNHEPEYDGMRSKYCDWDL